MPHPELKQEIELVHTVNENGIDDVPIKIVDKTDNDDARIMRSTLDSLTVWQALKTYRRVAFICLIAAFSASCDGYQGHFNGSIVANKGFIRQFSGGKTKLDSHWVSVWGGTASAGTFASQVGIAYVNDAFGRKTGLWVTWLVLTGSTFCESFVTTPGGWLAAKLLSGIGVGAMQGTLPLYLAEMSPTQLRGVFTQAYTFWFVIGQLLSSVPLQWYSQHDKYNYRTPIRIQFALSGILLVVYFFLPESPRWLVQKNKGSKALKVLQRLHKHTPGYDPEVELSIMENTQLEERKFNLFSGGLGFGIFRGLNGWRLLIACWPKVCQQFVGLSVFNSYATYFFEIAGYSDPFIITVILACVQLMSMIATIFLVDTWGRRPMTVYGYLITCLADYGMGATGFYNVQGNSAAGGILVFFACLATFTTTSASAIGYAYLSEIPTQDQRAKTASWGLAISNLFSIMFSYCTPLMIAKFSEKTALFFGSFGVVMVLIAWFIIPETARRTAAEIDEMFEARVAPRKFKKYVTTQQREAEAEADPAARA